MNQEKNKDNMSQFLQKQPYNLTIARHTLGIHQMRVMARAIEALQPSMTMEVDFLNPPDDMWLTIKVSELVVGGNVKPLREALDSLMKKIVRILHYLPEKATYLEIGTPIIQEYKHEHGEETVKLKISGSLLPQMIDLARGYTKYSLQMAFNTSSSNVFKLYQYIAHFRDKKQIQCNVDTLRKWLQIEDKYAMPSKIKERILNPAMRELKEKADVWFEIAERVTKGRKMLGWKFNIHTRKNEKKQIFEKKSIDIPPKSSEEEKLIQVYKLSSRQAKKLLTFVSKFDEEQLKNYKKVLYDIYLRIANNELKNIGGYCAKILGENFDIKL